MWLEPHKAELAGLRRQTPQGPGATFQMVHFVLEMMGFQEK
jgi:hypothetical protein